MIRSVESERMKGKNDEGIGLQVCVACSPDCVCKLCVAYSSVQNNAGRIHGSVSSGVDRTGMKGKQDTVRARTGIYARDNKKSCNAVQWA